MKSAMLAILMIVASSAPFIAHAQQVRHGVVMELTPIENRGNDETEDTKQKRDIGSRLGGMAGNALAILGPHKAVPYMGGVPDAASEAGGSLATKMGPPPPTTRFMVKLRLDDGKILPMTQLGKNLQDIQVGTKVRVEGTGSGAQIFAEAGR